VVVNGQCHIGDQRRQDPALRGSGHRLFPIAAGRHDPGFQERLHQRADPLALDPPTQAFHDRRVSELVETRRDVGLQHPVIALAAHVVDLGDRVLCTLVGAEPMRARPKVRLEDGFEH